MKLFDQVLNLTTGLSIKRKGILLVSIPLIFQLFFTIFLGVLYAQAERQAWQESQARLLMVRVNTIVWDLYNLGELLIAYAALHEPILLDKWHEKKKAISEELDSVKKLSLEHPESAKTYTRLLEVTNRGADLLEKVFQKAHEGRNNQNSGFDVFAVFPEIKPFLDSMNKEMEIVLTSDLNGQTQNVAQSDASRQLIASCLYVGVIIDVLIAMFLSVFFGAGIAARLAVISDNTYRAKNRQELNPSLSGADEIAELDQQFHGLISALKESEAIRSEFLSMTSHDLKTPLMSVELSVELVKRQLGSAVPTAVEEELQSAKENMHRVLTLINDLLDIERGASGKLKLELEDHNVKTLIEKSSRSVRPLAERKNVKIETNIESSSEDLEMLADRRRIEQVLVNLIANAVKFSPGGSSVYVRCTLLEKKIEIRVIDSGPGIPESDRIRIFERFEQSVAAPQGQDRGSGLGLAICKTIVLAHDGEIGVDHNPSGGSEFWFRISAVQ